MLFPDNEEAVRFFTDVKAAVIANPEVFQDDVLVLMFVEGMLESLTGEWKLIDTIISVPDSMYEINEEGIVRNKETREVVEPEYDIDVNAYVVKVSSISGNRIFLDGPTLAGIMFDRT
jgi:hypothetical protein